METKKQRILVHSLLAQWHMHSASNGHCETSHVMRGDHQLTPDELRDRAMATANTHINIIREVIDVPDKEWMKGSE